MLHKYVPTGLANKSTEFPVQNVVGPLGVMIATGFRLTVTVKLVVAEQPSVEYLREDG